MSQAPVDSKKKTAETTEDLSKKTDEISSTKNNSVQVAISPDELLSPYPYSPADNLEGYTSHLPWKSRIVGGWIRNALQWKNILKTVAESPQLFGPFSCAAQFQQWLVEQRLTNQIHLHAKRATRAGSTPDTYAEHDENIENAYGDMLYDLCTLCMTQSELKTDTSGSKTDISGTDSVSGAGAVISKTDTATGTVLKTDNNLKESGSSGSFKPVSTFDRKKTQKLSSSPEGIAVLKKYMHDFLQLEWQYNSLGLTRLKAMKELLLSLLVVITEKPIEKRDMPFPLKQKRDKPAPLFSDYLKTSRTRLENLYNHRAFNIKFFSEIATGCKIGYSKYEVVEGSRIHTVTLRHYFLPEGVVSNGKILYMVSPLINKAEIFDLAKGKSVVQGMLEAGYTIYLEAPGDPGVEDTDLGLDFYGKVVHDKYIEIIKKLHPDQEIYVMGYCMGGTIFMPYIARRAQERLSRGETMDIKKVALMATPVKFDDDTSGHGPMRKVITDDYDERLMHEMYGEVNVPPQIISVGMNEIQRGVQYNVAAGFYNRASFPGAIEDAAPFLYWLTHGTRFGSLAHRQWIRNIFMENQIYNQQYCLPSSEPHLDGKPVNMDILKEAGVQIFDYRGERDPISPTGSCVSSEIWGMVQDENLSHTRGGLNRTIEKNIGHIFVVSTVLLSEYLYIVKKFYDGKM
ncbi:MAG: alpha/beta hydrolase [Desulfamplus sp.]|nr:alpha/beta hydrolase [Desulfamplus sp.]